MRKALIAVVTGLLQWATIVGCRHETDRVSPYVETARQYRHNFYSSDEECRRIIGQNATKACSETIYFNTKGEASALAGGSDLLSVGEYQIEGDNLKATLKNGPVQTLTITFRIVSTTELLRVDNHTIWKAY
jgi:hypothetical protein